jgi:hypothetical protein
MPGYIVSDQGDTIVGLIGVRNNNQNSRSCVYRANEESKPKEYLPTDIKAYGLDNGLIYISKQIDIQGVMDYHFLEYLVNGTVDLYYLEYLNLGYYYIEKDNILKQLSKEDKEILIDGHRYIRESKQYIGVLNYLYGESPEMKSSIQNAAFTHKSLINITKEYHNNMCPDEECIVYKKSIKKRIVLEPILGLNYAKFNFDYDYDANIKPAIGCYIKIFPAKHNNFFSVNTGLIYSSNNYKYTYRRNTDDPYIGIDANVKFNTLKLPLNFEFTLKGGKFQPQIDFGIASIYLSDQSYDKTSSTYVEGNIIGSPITYYDQYVDFFRVYRAVNLGFGAKLNLNNKSYVSGKICYEYQFTSLAGYKNIKGGFLRNIFSATLGYGFQLTK